MLQARSLSSQAGVRHAFFTREGGVSGGLYASLNGGVGSNDQPDRVADNRARMAAALSVEPDHLITAYQIHSPEVAIAEKPWDANSRPRADGIVTRVAGLAIGISTADCGPVLLVDGAARVIGAAHAGWRGALSGILEATIAAMETLGAKRERTIAALGPTISQANYEVGADLRAQFLAQDRGNARFFAQGGRAGHAQFDLPGYIIGRLQRAGVGSVEDIGCCTYGDPKQFYSYRRATHRAEADYGRHINAIAIARD